MAEKACKGQGCKIILGMENPMLIPLLRWLTLLASLVFFLVYFKGGSSVVKDTQRSLVHAAGRSYRIAVTCMVPPALTILLTQFLVCLGIVKVTAAAQQPWIAIVGAILAVGGIAAAFWIRHRYLGRFWSVSAEIQAQHEVVDQGPYRTIRHPLYAASLLIYAGVALTFGVWWDWVACGMMLVGYVWLAAYEDKFLEENLTGYREYQRLTQYRLVPGIW